jgi:hypothetical protein
MLASLPSMAHQSSATIGRGADLRMLAALLALAMVAGALPRAVQAATGDPVLLNEALVSHTGADTTEYVELFGAPGTPLAGMSLVAVEGDGALAGTIDRRVDFPAGARLGGNGFYLVGNPTGLASHYHVVPDLAWSDDSLENGSQTLALVSTAGLGDAGTLVTGSETVHDSVGLTDGGASDAWFWQAPVVGPDDGFLPGGARRFTDGVDTDTVADWVFADDQLGPTNTPTPATPYNAPPTADCGPALTTDEGTAATASVTATDPDGRVVTFGAAISPGPGTVSVSGVVAAPAAGQPASAQVEVGTSTPPGSYVVTVTATNDDPTPQSVECLLSVTVNDLPDPTPEPPPPDPAPTPDTTALWAAVNDLAANGGMAANKLHLLTDRLERIDRLMASGQDAAAAAQLRAFANQAMGLSPHWLSDEAASALAVMASGLEAALSD